MVVSVQWREVWSAVALRMAAHRAQGRSHLLTEDVLRFETVLALAEAGVAAERLRAEVLDPSLAGGKLDLVVDPPRRAVIEFKFPRDSATGISPDTMTMGELLRDFFRVAGVEAQDRWVVQLLNARLVCYLRSAHGRYGLGWVDVPGGRLELAPASVRSLPETARRALGGVELGGGVTATCLLAEPVGDQLVLLAHRVDPLRPESQPIELPLAAPVPSEPEVPPMGAGTRDGARQEILAAARAVMAGTGRPEFSVLEVVEEMHRRGTDYATSTIRTMITSHLCAEASGERVAGYTDLTRVGRGRYRLSSPDRPVHRSLPRAP